MSNTSDQPPAVREAAERLTPDEIQRAVDYLIQRHEIVRINGWQQAIVRLDKAAIQAGIIVAIDHARLSAEVARLRGLNAELLTAGEHLAGYLDSFFASHMRECGRFECLKRWDAVAGRAAG